MVVLAQDEARVLKHNYIGTEHILLGLLREEEGVAASVLHSLYINVDEVRAQVARIIGEGGEVTAGQIPFTPRAKKVLELALREALHLGHNYIGTEHILLGLARENEGVAARVLLDFDADAEKIRNTVIEALGIDLAELEQWGKGRRIRRSRTRVLPTMQPCWEYRVERCDHVQAQFLNDLGAEGWELVSVNPSENSLELIFKRRGMQSALRAAG